MFKILILFLQKELCCMKQASLSKSIVNYKNELLRIMLKKHKLFVEINKYLKFTRKI